MHGIERLASHLAKGRSIFSQSFIDCWVVYLRGLLWCEKIIMSCAVGAMQFELGKSDTIPLKFFMNLKILISHVTLKGGCTQ